MSDPNLDRQPSFDDVARIIGDAAGYVGASPELRPRVVEEVRRSGRLRSGGVWMLLHAAVTLAALVVFAFFGQWLALAASPRGITSEQLHRRAAARSLASGVQFDWALVEVVSEWREGMAPWRHSDRPQ